MCILVSVPQLKRLKSVLTKAYPVVKILHVLIHCINKLSSIIYTVNQVSLFNAVIIVFNICYFLPLH